MDFSFTWDKISRILWHVMLPKQAMHCHSSYFTLLTSWKCFHWFHFRINLSKPGCKLLVCDTFWTKLRHRCNSATNYNADECLQLKVSICNIETSSHFKRNYTKKCNIFFIEFDNKSDTGNFTNFATFPVCRCLQFYDRHRHACVLPEYITGTEDSS